MKYYKTIDETQESLINRSIFGKESPIMSKTCWKCKKKGENKQMK